MSRSTPLRLGNVSAGRVHYSGRTAAIQPPRPAARLSSTPFHRTTPRLGAMGRGARTGRPVLRVSVSLARVLPEQEHAAPDRQ